MSVLVPAEVAVGAVLFGGLATYWVVALRGAARHERAAVKAQARAGRAHYAAVEAAEDEPAFSPDSIAQSVTELVTIAEGFWREGADGVLDARPDAGLVRAWARSWESRLGTGLEVAGRPSIDLLGVVNRDDDEQDRVVVRLRLRIHCERPSVGVLGPHHAHLDERWTLGRSDNRWLLLSVAGDPLAAPLLTAPLIPDPSSDTERLREESMAELASAQQGSDDIALNDLVSADTPPAFALLDLSIVDGRFLPALIGAELAHLLAAWEGAAVGSERPLEELASDDARAALLRPGPGARLIIRDAVLKSWEPTRLDLVARPPSIELTLEVEAVRYVVEDDGHAVAGNTTDTRRMALTWTLELSDSTRSPWWLATSNNPAEAIPGWR